MTYTHLSQTERYQIYVLMKAGQTQTEIAHILGRHKSTISREVARGSGRRGYRPHQAQNLSDERSQCSRNATHINEQILLQVRSLLSLEWSPEQIASKLPISHETIYQKVYADKAMGGHLWRSLRCQKQKRKRYAGGRDRRGQIPDRRSITERPE
jgi:IS30 family transposase